MPSRCLLAYCRTLLVCLRVKQLEGRDVKSIWGAPQSESDIRDVFVAYIDGRIPMVGSRCHVPLALALELAAGRLVASVVYLYSNGLLLEGGAVVPHTSRDALLLLHY